VVKIKTIAMKIFINNEIQEFEEGISLELVLEQHQLTAKNGIAVAVNEEIIPKTKWEQTRLFEGDKIIVIGAVAGG
jgi:sulfur carrier protein